MVSGKKPTIYNGVAKAAFMRITEFYDREFLNQNYLFKTPCSALKNYIDFFWQSNYLFEGQVSIKTFPRIGSTVLINLGSDFLFSKGALDFSPEDHLYYVRNRAITTSHKPGNLLLGIQFKINLPLLYNPKAAANNAEIYNLQKFIEA